MLIMSYIGDHVWLMTSRQTDPDLFQWGVRTRDPTLLIDCYIQLIDVRMEDPVDEANTWAFVRVLIGQFHVDFPVASGEGCCIGISTVEFFL